MRAGPSFAQIVLASVVVMAGCSVAAFSFWFGVRHRNWLLHIVGLGAAIFVVGMVGERAPVPGTGRPSTVWDLSIHVPVLSVTVDQVMVVGVVLILLGVSLVLFLERVVPPEKQYRPSPQRPLDEDDSV
jgi:hypothetical protein